ncbi:MAG: S8 family serine peptidase [Acidobacteriota bacterium]|nr:S8 family serine peptidase [Acidobacteriota bacterium]
MPLTARAVVPVILLSLLLSAPALAAGVPLRLQVGSFDPQVSLPDLPENLRLSPSERATADVRVIQFDGRLTAERRRLVEGTGARVLGYLPRQAWIVRAGERSRAALAALPGLRWEGPVEPGWKISPELGRRPYRDSRRRSGARLLVTIDLWPGSDATAIADRLVRQGAELRATWTDHGTLRLLVRAPRPLLEAIAHQPDVAFIEEYPEATLRNDGASWVIQSNVQDLRPIWEHGLHGEGQVMGNIDGRLDLDSCYFDDGGSPPGPNHRKVIAYRSGNGQGADSHGTHTNGTMAGDKGTWGAWDSGDGHAFAAKISFTNLDDISGSGSAPSNLKDNLIAAHQDGARTHSNSWGDDGTTSYTSWSRDIDDFSWQYEDSLVLFAVTNGSNLKTPENAKNVLAVGASEREGNADNHCSGGRGPTSDGRRKPEIFAPGCSTVSAASGESCGTRSLTGTSMASPAVTGAATLVREYFTEGWYPSGAPVAADALVPSGALMKAVLISGAMDMTGVAGYPSDQEGWGRVNLERSLFFAGDSRGLVVLDDLRRSAGLSTGEAATYPLEVDASGQPLRITLVFTEPPAELMAAEATVNNLDLKVTAPDGTVYWGNQTDGNGNSVPGGTADPINNLEQVLFDSPAAGSWTVEVIAADVAIGPQGFALVATGGVSPTTGPRLTYDGHRLLDDPPLGGGDGILDPGETLRLPLQLANRGNEGATHVTGDLRVDRDDWARITLRSGQWPDLDPGATAEMTAPYYELTVAPDAPCGQVLHFTQNTRSAEAEAQESRFSIAIGNVERDYPDGPPLDLPSSFFGGLESPQDVIDDARVGEIDVTVDISHGDVGELLVMLVSPAGTQVTLHNRSHAGEQDLKLRYDRDRPADGPGSLDDFKGEGAQGTWTLVINDNRESAVAPGRLHGWTLHLRADRALECSPLDCGDPVPPETSGLMIRRDGADLLHSWQATAGASGYHLLESGTASMAEAVLTGRTQGATEFRQGGGAGAFPTLRFFKVRATNTCNWEGP